MLNSRLSCASVHDVIDRILGSLHHVVDLAQAYSGAVQAFSAVVVAFLTWFLVRFTSRSVRGTEKALDFSRQQLDLLREQNAEQRQSIELTREQYRREALEAHREEINSKVLVPLRLILREYETLPQFSVRFVPEHQHDANAKVTDYPWKPGMALYITDPQIGQADLDTAFYQDAAKNHHRSILAQWETFRDSWTNHMSRRHVRIEALAERILGVAGLRPHPVNDNGPYVMHLSLALFAYKRLLQIPTGSLHNQRFDNYWVLSDGTTQYAKGSRESIQQVLVALDQILESERSAIAEFEAQFSELQTIREDLVRKLSMAIADRTLPEKCPLVGLY